MNVTHAMWEERDEGDLDLVVKGLAKLVAEEKVQLQVQYRTHQKTLSAYAFSSRCQVLLHAM